jgi:hypothetical protein
VFSGSSTSSVTVGSDSSGNAAATTFTANDIAGSYTVTASSQYGTVTFSLTNTASGVPATVVPMSSLSSSAKVSANYPQPLSVEVLDANGAGLTQSTATGHRFPIALHATVTDAEGNSVSGVPVTITAPKTGPGGRFVTHARDRQTGRNQTTRHRIAVVKTNGCGIATAPAFDANDRAGSYIIKATEPHAKPVAFALLNTRRRAR